MCGNKCFFLFFSENKGNHTVSVVRVGKPIQRDPSGESDEGDVSQVNLTVEGFYSPSAASTQDFIDDNFSQSDGQSDIVCITF